MIKEYPEWDEIKGEVCKVDLLAIVEMAIEVGIEDAIQGYIEANYEPILIKDMDKAYEEARDEKRNVL